MKKSNIVYIEDIREALDKIEKYTDGISFEEFKTNEMCHDAVIRQLMIIGEASNRIDRDYLTSYPEFPLKQAIEMRNFLIHNYDDVDLEIVWKTIKESLPQLKNSVKKILA